MKRSLTIWLWPSRTKSNIYLVCSLSQFISSCQSSTSEIIACNEGREQKKRCTKESLTQIEDIFVYLISQMTQLCSEHTYYSIIILNIFCTMIHLEILLKCKFQFSRLGMGPRVYLPTSTHVMLRLLVCGSHCTKELAYKYQKGRGLRFKHHCVNYFIRISVQFILDANYWPNVTQLLNLEAMIEPQVNLS